MICYKWTLYQELKSKNYVYFVTVFRRQYLLNFYHFFSVLQKCRSIMICLNLRLFLPHIQISENCSFNLCAKFYLVFTMRFSEFLHGIHIPRHPLPHWTEQHYTFWQLLEYMLNRKDSLWSHACLSSSSLEKKFSVFSNLEFQDSNLAR